MGILIDSSILIDAERGRLHLDQRLSALADESVAISSITASELLQGVHRAKTTGQRARRGEFVEWVFQLFSIAPFDLAEARIHAELWADLHSRGVVIGAHDLLIGATALALGFRLATANLREFHRIPGLKVEDWSS